jgi:acetyl-CoA acetyltransferase
MADAGIARSEVEMLLTGRGAAADMVPQVNMRVVNELKVAPRYSSEVTVHGAGAIGMLAFAAMAITSHAVDYAVCCSGNVSALWMDVFRSNSADEADPQFELPYSPTTAALYAQVASRYFHERDVTPADCARIAVEARRWALHHPWAAMRDKGEISVEDVLASPEIASPLRRLDCAPYYPGAITVALVLTSARRAKERHQRPVFLVGFGQRTTHEYLTERLGLHDLPGLASEPSFFPTGASSAAEQAFAMAHLKPTDIDLVQTSAPFTFFAALMLEELGFAPSGKVGAFIREGGIDLAGGLPFNTSGGNLSFGQSGQGLYLALECIEQLRGEARGRQVADARLALVHGHGGVMASHAVAILAGEEPQGPRP